MLMFYVFKNKIKTRWEGKEKPTTENKRETNEGDCISYKHYNHPEGEKGIEQIQVTSDYLPSVLGEVQLRRMAATS